MYILYNLNFDNSFKIKYVSIMKFCLLLKKIFCNHVDNSPLNTVIEDLLLLDGDALSCSFSFSR